MVGAHYLGRAPLTDPARRWHEHCNSGARRLNPMLMLITTLVSANAHAGGLLLNSGLCNGHPCIGFLDTNSSIVPPDLFESWQKEGDVNYLRVELTDVSGDVEVDVNGYTLGVEFLSESESQRGDLVYYVPASYGARIVVANVGRDAASYSLSVSPAARATR